MRNLLATVPQGAREAIAAIVRTIFAQPDHGSAMTQLRKVAEGLRGRFARAAAVLEEAAEDILAYRHSDDAIGARTVKAPVHTTWRRRSNDGPDTDDAGGAEKLLMWMNPMQSDALHSIVWTKSRNRRSSACNCAR